MELVQNRNQRKYLSRFRTGSHQLRVETGRWTFPKTKYEDRTCIYCDSGHVDTELHCITQCKLTETDRNIFYTNLCQLDNRFHLLNNEQKMAYILCPTNALRIKLSNNFLKLLVKARSQVDQEKNI